MKTSKLAQLITAIAGTTAILILGQNNIAKAATIEYFNHNNFINATGSLTLIDFDSLTTGETLIGNEYLNQGLTVIHRDNQPINIVSAATNTEVSSNNVNSSPNVISSVFFSGGGFNDSRSENYDFIFTNSVSAAGLYIGNIGSGSGSPTQVQFLDTNNNIIAEEIFTISNPNLIGSGFDNRIFYGITSTESIALIRTVEPANDVDGVVYDDVQFSSDAQPITDIPESSNILGLFLVAGVTIFTGIKFKKKEDPQTEENT